MSDIDTTIKNLFDLKDSVRAVVFEWDPTKNAAVVTCTGSSGIEDIKSNLDETKCMVGICAVNSIDTCVESVSTQRTYYVCVNFLGAKVKPMRRRDMGSLRNVITPKVGNVHVSIECVNVDEVNIELLEKKLFLACGSHKPKGFKWSE
ncbi:hypothetical protein ABK040_010042 [Willaertia magna]